MQHLLRIEQLNTDWFFALAKLSNDCLLTDGFSKQFANNLGSKNIATLFFEPSTRARISFTLAAQNLGANVIDLKQDYSSVQKGETIQDTVASLMAMGVDAFILRHSEPGLPGRVAKAIGNTGHVINAGDGCHQHPTQALIDAFTIYKKGLNFTKISVAIVGDVLHSRVARSQVELFSLLGVKDIRLVAPSLISPSSPWPNTILVNDLSAGIKGADVIIALRSQLERMNNTVAKLFELQKHEFLLDQKSLLNAKKNVIIMHPGPCNPGEEISSDVLTDPRCVILQQVRYGVAVRMALLMMMLG